MTSCTIALVELHTGNLRRNLRYLSFLQPVYPCILLAISGILATPYGLAAIRTLVDSLSDFSTSECMTYVYSVISIYPSHPKSTGFVSEGHLMCIFSIPS